MKAAKLRLPPRQSTTRVAELSIWAASYPTDRSDIKACGASHTTSSI
jgi:hypothetical protein